MNQSFKDKIKSLTPVYETGVFDKFFTWKDLENLLNLRPFINDKRFIVTNNLKQSWSVPTCYWLTEVSSFPPNIISYYVQNYVCYIKDCSRVNEKINSLCNQLELLTGKPTDAHIYFDCTNVEGSGFPPHWDFSDNLIVQMEGESTFKVWDLFAKENDPRTQDKINQSPFIDITLKQGDAIFVPSKMWHQAISKTKRLSISFPMNRNLQEGYSIQERDWIKIEDK